MSSHIDFLHQLPQTLQAEVSAHVGSVDGMSEIQVVIRYRDVAWQLRSIKLASIPANYEGYPGHLTVNEYNDMAAATLEGVSQVFVDIHHQMIANEGAWYLENFHTQLMVILNRLTDAAQHHAQQQADEAARQDAQRRAEEEAHRLAQQQAEEAARQLIQRQAEETVRLEAQRQAEEAARLAAEEAARQLAKQQADAAAAAFAQRMAEEEALREARMALELTATTNTEHPVAGEGPTTRGGEPISQEVQRIHFLPGPAATAEIERATVELKSDIDMVITKFATAIEPFVLPANVANAVVAQ
jgi:chemotaxis protein histidine kinase CheA